MAEGKFMDGLAFRLYMFLRYTKKETAKRCLRFVKSIWHKRRQRILKYRKTSNCLVRNGELKKGRHAMKRLCFGTIYMSILVSSSQTKGYE